MRTFLVRLEEGLLPALIIVTKKNYSPRQALEAWAKKKGCSVSDYRIDSELVVKAQVSGYLRDKESIIISHLPCIGV